jgi:hypothetical protein
MFVWQFFQYAICALNVFRFRHKKGNGAASKAFQRYFQGHQSRAINVTKNIKKLSISNQLLININKVRDANK